MPEHDWYMPLNLIWLANYILQYGYDVEILDGQLMNLDEILNKIDADIVGVSFDILSLNEFKEIILTAKRKNCFTLTGGHLATAIGEELLISLPELDAIIVYDGEESLLNVIRDVETKKKLSTSINNLIFREDNQIIATKVSECDINNTPLLRRDVGGLNIEEYIANYQISKRELNLPFGYNRPINSYSHKGCLFRQNGNGCSFCSRVDRRFRVRSAKKVYEEYRYLSDELHVDHISDFSDSWIFTPFLSELIKEYDKKGAIQASLRVYGDVRLININNIDLIKDLGVKTILLGIESGNDRVLKLNGKFFTRRKVLDTVELLARHEIQISDAYVLGLVGDDFNSVEDTISLAKQIKQMCTTEITYCNIATPLPGNKLWEKILPTSEIFNLCDLNSFDTEYLEMLNIERSCHLGNSGYNYLKCIRSEILSLSKISSSEFVLSK